MQTHIYVFTQQFEDWSLCMNCIWIYSFYLKGNIDHMCYRGEPVNVVYGNDCWLVATVTEVATPTEVGYTDWGFSVFFSSVVRQMPGLKPAKTGHGPHFSKIFVLYVLFVLCHSVYCVCVCKCVLHDCHLVATQLRLTDIYHNRTKNVHALHGKMRSFMLLQHMAQNYTTGT